MVRRTLRVVVASLAAVCMPLAALAQSSPPLTQWHHTAWTARDGLTGRPRVLAQAADGFLWVGSTEGLFRFDGALFERVRPDNGELPRVSVSALIALPDGGLWIGYAQGGASLLDAQGRATSYDGDDGLPYGAVRSLARTDDGAIWLAAVGGLARFADGRWQRVRQDWGYSGRSASALFRDRAGTLWLGGATPDALLYLPRGSRRFAPAVTGIAAARFAQTSDGTLLVADRARPVIHALRPGAPGAYVVRPVADFEGTAIAADADDRVWVSGDGLSRLTHNDGGTPRNWSRTEFAVDRFSQADGLVGSFARDVLVDRESNVWVTTDTGLNRLRPRNLTWALQRTNSLATSLVAGPGTDVWALWWNAGIRRVANGDQVPGAPGPEGLWWGCQAPDDTIWIGGAAGLWRWRDGSFSPIAPPPDVTARRQRFAVLAATVDRTGRLWASISGAGQYRMDGNVWTFVPVVPGRPDLTAMSAYAAADGRVWLVYPESVAVMDGGTTRVFPAGDIGIGALRTVGGREDLVWIGGEKGLAVFLDGRFVVVREGNAATPLGSIGSLVATAAHGLWLNAGARIVNLPQREIDRLRNDPTRPARFEAFDLISDLPEPLQDHDFGETVIEDRSETLWFVTAHHVARLDPRRIRRNTLPPPVVIRALMADDRRYPARDNVQLPALTRSIRIEYAALSLTIPERVKFRYRLEGWETDWHEATERRAFYTDLRPGTYTFRVLGSNNDGVWNETGAGLAFSVAPAWHQTQWFRGLVVASLAGGLVLLYRRRVRRLTTELTARFDERLAERTRLARDLHDTLLQTVQGSRMVARHAISRTDDPAATRRELERLSGWLDRAVDEARAALNALRGADLDTNDLTEAFRHLAEGFGEPASAVTVSTAGNPRPLHPVVRDEICAIGSEAIRNACTHAQASKVSVAIEYGRDFVLLVTDNGTGMDQAVLETGKSGHFGLAGMRERAAGIQAALSMTTSAAGTSLRLAVPGRLAFRGR